MAKDAGDPIDHRHHFLAARYGKSATIAEIILYVDHQQNVAVKEFDAHPLSSFPRLFVPPEVKGGATMLCRAA
jgi:hypothetical protein